MTTTSISGYPFTSTTSIGMPVQTTQAQTTQAQTTQAQTTQAQTTQAQTTQAQTTQAQTTQAQTTQDQTTLYDYKKKEIHKNQKGKAIGLGIGLTINSIFLLYCMGVIFMQLMNLINTPGYIRMNEQLIWFFIASIILIGIGIAEYFTYNNYKDMYGEQPAGGGMTAGTTEMKKYVFDEAIKYFSYINFAVGGILLLLVLINYSNIIVNKKQLIEKDNAYSPLVKEYNQIYDNIIDNNISSTYKLQSNGFYYKHDGGYYHGSIDDINKEITKIKEFLKNMDNK